MALMQLTVIPLGTGSTSAGRYVAEISKALDQEGAAYTLTDMGTIIQGDTVELLALAARLHELPFRHQVKRVVTHIVLDDRRDKEVVLGDKVSSVAKLLN